MSHSARCAALACCCTRFNSCCAAWLPSAFTASMPAVRVSKYCPAGRRSSLAWSRTVVHQAQGVGGGSSRRPAPVPVRSAGAGACCRARCRTTWLPLSNSSARVHRGAQQAACRLAARRAPARGAHGAHLAQLFGEHGQLLQRRLDQRLGVAALAGAQAAAVLQLLAQGQAAAPPSGCGAPGCAGVTAPSPRLAAVPASPGATGSGRWPGQGPLASSSAVACRVRPSSSRTAGRRPASRASPPSWPADGPRCTCVKRTDWPAAAAPAWRAPVCPAAAFARPCCPQLRAGGNGHHGQRQATPDEKLVRQAQMVKQSHGSRYLWCRFCCGEPSPKVGMPIRLLFSKRPHLADFQATALRVPGLRRLQRTPPGKAHHAHAGARLACAGHDQHAVVVGVVTGSPSLSPITVPAGRSPRGR